MPQHAAAGIQTASKLLGKERRAATGAKRDLPSDGRGGERSAYCKFCIKLSSALQCMYQAYFGGWQAGKVRLMGTCQAIYPQHAMNPALLAFEPCKGYYIGLKFGSLSPCNKQSRWPVLVANMFPEH